MRVLFTICARAGSKGVKNKNIRCMKKIPLAYYTLAAIGLYGERHTGDMVSVAVNTDSRELKEQIQSQDVIRDIRFLPRKESLAGDETAKVDVIRDCLEQCGGKTAYDAVVDLDLTSPMRRVEDIEAAVAALTADENTDLVFSAVAGRRNPYFNMVEERNGYFRKVCAAAYKARQQAPHIYELNASIYVYRPAFLAGPIEKSILDYNGTIVRMPDYLVLDIDSEEDFRQMEFVMDYFREQDSGLAEVMAQAGRINAGSRYMTNG
ncbi:acylneuraminate cytidylyltransferase family protein [Clostridiaceae bacterium]|nr:acylneuraminate cytidylyltransferase family protein [Clostridiaceae bacterium]